MHFMVVKTDIGQLMGVAELSFYDVVLDLFNGKLDLFKFQQSKDKKTKDKSTQNSPKAQKP